MQAFSLRSEPERIITILSGPAGPLGFWIEPNNNFEIYSRAPYIILPSRKKKKKSRLISSL